MRLLRGPRRIANKIILLVLSLELVSIVIWGSLTYMGSRHELLASIGSRLSEAALRATQEIGSFFVPIYVETEVFLATLDAAARQPDGVRVLAYRLLNSRPEIEEISVVEPDNVESLRISRMAAYGPRDRRDLELDPLVRRARLERRAAEPIGFSEYLEPRMRIALQVTPPAPDFPNRMAIVTINLKWLWDSVQMQRIGKTGYIFVVDEHRALIAHRNPSRVLAKPDLSRTAIPPSFFEGQGRRELALYANFGNERVAGVSRFDPLHKWWVVVEQPVAEGLAPLDRLINRFILAFLAAATVTIAIVVVFSRVTMRPLRALQEGIARIARGERNVSVEVPSQSELAGLVQAFNTMAKHLDRKISGLVASEREIRASREALRVSEEQVRLLLESTAESIFGIDLEGRVTFCNPAAMRLFGYSHQDLLLGQSIFQLLKPKTPDGQVVTRETCLPIVEQSAVHGTHMKDIVLQRADGSTLHAECWLHPTFRDDAPIGAVVTIVDITERYHHMAELRYHATHDALTGLANRKLLHGRLEEAVRLAQNGEAGFVLMLIDLDRFKEINDSLGHKSGDLLLKQIGPRVQSLISREDTLARLGGDEFAVLTYKATSSESALRLASRLRQAILEPFDIDGMRVQVDTSIGVALCPMHATDGSTLLRYADVAMYQAKRTGTGYALYDKRADAHSPHRLALVSDLLQATNNNELALFYQPKIDMVSGEVRAVEALVRWNHERHGVIMPEDFIPLAELGELIKSLTLWVIERAIEDRQRWRSQGHELSIAANISARNLQDLELADRVNRLLRKHAFPPQALQLEITESAIMTDPVRARDTIETMANLGISFAVDDFGTGYSSLAYLKQLAVDELKIDRSFVTDMERDENDAAIVRSTIELSHNLGMRVTAEGVETESLWRRLDELACDYAQGYYICRPIPADQVLPWMLRWNHVDHVRSMFHN